MIPSFAESDARLAILLEEGPFGIWASTTGRGAKDRITAPFWSIWICIESSICFQIGRVKVWRHGYNNGPELRRLRATDAAFMPKAHGSARPTRTGRRQISFDSQPLRRDGREFSRSEGENSCCHPRNNPLRPVRIRQQRRQPRRYPVLGYRPNKNSAGNNGWSDTTASSSCTGRGTHEKPSAVSWVSRRKRFVAGCERASFRSANGHIVGPRR